MCGIFGYVGPSFAKALEDKHKKNATQIVFDGLKKLEYRGYDSWGIAAQKSEVRSRKSEIIIEKHVGKIGDSNLKSKIFFSEGKLRNLKSNIALGHTRWATHGGVTVANAHPHLDCTGKLAIVHNGIVENYLELKKKLAKNHKFKSETDTEVIVHLIEELGENLPLDQAVRKAFLKLKGLSAIVLMTDSKLIAAKNGSPLVIGIGRDSYFIASDAAALLPHTKNVIFLKDGELAVITSENAEIVSIKTGDRVKTEIETLNWQIKEVQLGTYEHYMIKEIYEQSSILKNIAQNYSGQIKSLCKIINDSKGVFLIGAGTAYHACLAGSYLFSKIARMHVNTLVASEFNYLEDFLNKKSLIIAFSQSGETIDVIEPLKRAKDKGAKIAAVVNNAGSSIWQMADYRLDLACGPEIAVASTKVYLAKLAILILSAYGLIGKFNEGKHLIRLVSDEVDRVLKEEFVGIGKIAKVLSKSDHIFTIGRGLSYQTALEAALKIKEVSYRHTEGLAGGELKHGSIALISEGIPCIVFAPKDETYDAIISNATEIKARGGLIIGISPKNHQVFDYWIRVKDCGAASIIANVVPAQLLGYLLAIGDGLDPDKPRNLAKSVTVK